jgi:hypothetical protein
MTAGTARILQGQMSRSQPREKLELPIGRDPALQLFTEGYEVFKCPRLECRGKTQL